MWFSSDHMVVTTTGFCFSTQQRSAFASLLTARTPAGSVASVVAPFFVAHSRLARAESKRQSQRDPALRGDGGRDFDSRRAQGVTAGLSKRGLQARGRRASAGLQHPNKLKMHNDAEPSLLPPVHSSTVPGSTHSLPHPAAPQRLGRLGERGRSRSGGRRRRARAVLSTLRALLLLGVVAGLTS